MSALEHRKLQKSHGPKYGSNQGNGEKRKCHVLTKKGRKADEREAKGLNGQRRQRRVGVASCRCFSISVQYFSLSDLGWTHRRSPSQSGVSNLPSSSPLGSRWVNHTQNPSMIYVGHRQTYMEVICSPLDKLGSIGFY